MGLDILINAVLRAVGFERAQFDDFMTSAQADIAKFREKAENTHSRIQNIETQLTRIESILMRVALQDAPIPARNADSSNHINLES